MTTLNLQVSASANDAYAIDSATSANLTSTTLEVGIEASTALAALTRFLNVTIAQGTTITSATYTLKARLSYTGPATLKVYVQAEDADNSAIITTATNNIQGRSKTSTPTSWDVHAWTSETDYSIDVTTHVQAVINRAGWVSGNALSIIITNNTAPSNEWQDAYTYDNTPAKAAKLDIVYTAGGAGLPFFMQSELLQANLQTLDGGMQ
jgi:hypothetical protein